MLFAVLHFLPDEDHPTDIVRTFLEALPPGSYVAASHGTAEHNPGEVNGGLQAFKDAGITVQMRDSDEFARVAFPGLELVSPGIVLVSEWRPDSDAPRPPATEVNTYGGVARKI
jgi:hypothetical protein